MRNFFYFFAKISKYFTKLFAFTKIQEPVFVLTLGCKFQEEGLKMCIWCEITICLWFE